DDLIAEFERFVAPIRETGVADPAKIEEEVKGSQSIAVVASAEPNASIIVPPDDVVLREMLKDTGILGKSWGSYPQLSRARSQLERWLLPRVVPSPRYDSAATQKARREARDAVPPATIRFNAGNLLLPAGKPIDEDTLQILRAEFDQIDRTIGLDQRLVRMLT